MDLYDSTAGLHLALIRCGVAAECVGLPVMVYLTLWRSQQMRRYRFYILNNCVANFALDWAILVARPKFEWPRTCAVLNSALPADGVFLKAVMVSGFFLVTCVNMGVVYSLFYRYAQVRAGRKVGGLFYYKYFQKLTSCV